MQPVADSASAEPAGCRPAPGSAPPADAGGDAGPDEFVVASVQEIRDRWSHYVQFVRTTGRSVLVTHMRKPVAALISLDDLQLLEAHDDRPASRQRDPGLRQ